jgi:hypothetical protein
MARNAWESHVEEAVMDMKICTTQPAGMDLDENLSCLRLRYFPFHDFPWSVDLCHDGSFHENSPLGLVRQNFLNFARK